MNINQIADKLNMDVELLQEDLLSAFPNSVNWNWENLTDEQIANIASMVGKSFTELTGTSRPQKRSGSNIQQTNNGLPQPKVKERGEAVRYINGQRLTLRVNRAKAQQTASDNRAKATGYIDAQREYHQYRNTKDTVFNQLVTADEQLEDQILLQKAVALDEMLINDANKLQSELGQQMLENDQRSGILGELLTGLEELTSTYQTAFKDIKF